MKKKFIAVLSASLITAGAIGGVAFASSISDGSSNQTQQMAVSIFILRVSFVLTTTPLA